MPLVEKVSAHNNGGKVFLDKTTHEEGKFNRRQKHSIVTSKANKQWRYSECMRL